MIALTLQSLSKVLADKNADILSSDKILNRKLFAGFSLLAADILSLSISFLSVILLKHYLTEEGLVLSNYFILLPLIAAIFPITFYFSGLYPGYGLSIIDEIKSLTYSISIVFIVLASLTFFLRGEWEYSRAVFFISWIVSLVILPFGRRFVRKILSRNNLWGIPVMIIGAGKAGENTIRSLKKQLPLGLIPVVAVDENTDRWGYIDKVPVIGSLDIIPDIARKLNIEYCIFASPELESEKQVEIINKYSKYFPNTLVISDYSGLSYLWVNTKDIAGNLGFELRQKLLNKSVLVRKRIFDFIFGLILGLLTLPLLLIIGILIKLDSGGKVFFFQERLSLNMKRFRIFKFRTMYENAEERLNEVLKLDESKRIEFDKYHKLKDDPRLTRIGKILRKYSLDELPQFWNVVLGDMSLVGPRAYLYFEYVKMEESNRIIFNVRPGLSGLWQITGRSKHSFQNRLNLDLFYIRNWSFFLDIYILVKTISAVYNPDGAY